LPTSARGLRQDRVLRKVRIRRDIMEGFYRLLSQILPVSPYRTQAGSFANLNEVAANAKARTIMSSRRNG